MDVFVRGKIDKKQSFSLIYVRLDHLIEKFDLENRLLVTKFIKIVKTVLSNNDFIVHKKGYEFIIYLNYFSGESINNTIDIIVNRVKDFNLKIPHSNGKKLALSFGYATSYEGNDLNSLIAKARTPIQ